MITIVIYKNIKLVLTFLDWFICPVWKRNWDSTYRVLQIEVGFKHDNTTGSHYVTRRAKTDFQIWFLFFRLHFPLWWTDEKVAMIYPANYNWKEDPLFDQKYLTLVQTEYFQ